MSSSLLPSPDNDYTAPEKMKLSEAAWNATMNSIGARIRTLEALRVEWETLISLGTGQALEVISANVAPQLAALTETLSGLQADVTAAEDAIAGIVSGSVPMASVSGLVTALAAKVAIADLTTTVANLTASIATKATPADIATAVATLVNSSPSTLDTLKELADALGDDANFSTTVTNALANRLRFDAAAPLTSVQQTQAFANLGVSFNSYFSKADYSSVVFTRTGNAAISLKAGTEVSVAGIILRYLMATPVTMPALTAGTDYAVYVCSDGSLRADVNFSAPTGYTTANSRRIGGFHYAAGGNATAQAGGDTTAQINPYSLWDIKWRPACPDPRGMTLVAGRFWADIYLTGTDVDANGSSRYGVTIADGSSPAKIPALFGGNGSTAYGSFTWWQAGEVLSAVGKELLSYGDFAAAAYGVSEGVSRGNDPVTTGFATTNAGSSNADQKFTSKWGIIQAAGCIWVWGRDISGSAGSNAWQDVTGGRGQLYGTSIAAIFGGYWTGGAFCGSRASYWGHVPWVSYADIAARGRCDHLSHV